MNVMGMVALNATALGILIAINLALSMTSELLWLALGAFSLIATMAFCYRQGMGMGHSACAIRDTVERARKAGEAVYSQLDRPYLSKAWDMNTGLRGLLASALVPYAVGCLYIVAALLNARDAILLPLRMAAFVLSMPYWPFIMHWHESFVGLTPAIVAMLMLTPFILPASTFFGFLQGPKLWARSEEAMKQGRRRAKAKSRVAQKQKSRVEKPEI